MKAWTDVTFELDGSERLLLVTAHDETTMQVSLHAPGYSMDGMGFDIRFTTAHIPAIAKLLEELQSMKALENRANAQLALEDSVV